jgi:hypothetical protein
VVRVHARVFANPEETSKRKRVILREEVNPAEAEALRDAAERVLRGETVGSIIREWTRRGIKPAHAQKWEETSLVNTLKSPRLAGLREWQGHKYPAQWPAIIHADTHERLARLFPTRRAARTWCAASGTCCPGSRGAASAAGRFTPPGPAAGRRRPTGASPGRPARGAAESR